MRQVEIQAFSVEEAVRLALEQLGRSRDEVSVEVLATDPGSEEVLVRVTVRDTGRGNALSEEEASPRERRQPTQGENRGGMRGAGGGMGQGGRRGDRGDRGRGPGQGQGGGRFDRPRGGYGGAGGGNRFDRGPGAAGGYERYGQRPSRAFGNAAPTPRPESEEFDEDDNFGNRIEADVQLDASLQAGTTEAGSPEDAVAPVAAEVLQKILMRMKVRGHISRRDPADEGDAAFPDDQQSLTLNVTGLNERDQNTLIGRRGETLDALQFIVNLIVGRQVDLWTRIIVDVEGYRLRRKFALINLARRTAEQVQQRRQAIPLEAMPPYERRIIHMALSEHPDVVTESSGAEPERRVVVLPR